MEESNPDEHKIMQEAHEALIEKYEKLKLISPEKTWLSFITSLYMAQIIALFDDVGTFSEFMKDFYEHSTSHFLFTKKGNNMEIK